MQNCTQSIIISILKTLLPQSIIIIFVVVVVDDDNDVMCLQGLSQDPSYLSFGQVAS